ncbi:MAG: DUF4239 domain-containing protein [Chloroflexota bacterium]
MFGISTEDYGLILLVLAVVAAIVLLVRSRLDSVLTRDADSVAAVSAAAIAVYGLILGLTLAAAWERYQRSDETLNAELNEMFVLFRIADNWAGAEGGDLQQAVVDYGIAVSDYELTGQSADQIDNAPARAEITRMYQLMREITSGPGGSSNAIQPAWTALANLDVARGQRLTLTRQALPDAFWTVLWVGGAISLLLLIVIHPENRGLHLAISLVAALLIILTLVLLRELDAPLSGTSTIDFDSFRSGVAVLQKSAAAGP